MEYLDLYLIHAPNPEISLAETMRAMDELMDRGLIRNIGVSNFSIAELEEAQVLTKHKIVTNQIHYSLAYQEWKDVVKYCQANDILITAYRPVERGMLSEDNIEVLDKMCQKYQKTPSQIVINWLTSQDNVVTLVKTSNMDHLKENLGSLDWEMSKEDIEKLAAEFPDIGVV